MDDSNSNDIASIPVVEPCSPIDNITRVKEDDNDDAHEQDCVRNVVAKQEDGAVAIGSVECNVAAVDASERKDDVISSSAAAKNETNGTPPRVTLFAAPSAVLPQAASRRQCRFPGCTKTIKSQGHCQKHGARAKRCKVPSCDKQAQGTHEGMCKRHWKEACAPKPSSSANDELLPPSPTGHSVYDLVIPASIAWKATKKRIMDDREVMPLVQFLRDNSHLEPGWHRLQERASRGIRPPASSAAQFESWERQLVMFEIMLVAGTMWNSHKDLAHGWGREKGFHHVLVGQVCERRGELDRKKRSDSGRHFSEEQKAKFRVKLHMTRSEKRQRIEHCVAEVVDEVANAAAAVAGGSVGPHEEEEESEDGSFVEGDSSFGGSATSGGHHHHHHHHNVDDASGNAHAIAAAAATMHDAMNVDESNAVAAAAAAAMNTSTFLNADTEARNDNHSKKPSSIVGERNVVVAVIDGDVPIQPASIEEMAQENEVIIATTKEEDILYADHGDKNVSFDGLNGGDTAEV